jgi:hypothetical protein
VSRVGEDTCVIVKYKKILESKGVAFPAEGYIVGKSVGVRVGLIVVMKVGLEGEVVGDLVGIVVVGIVVVVGRDGETVPSDIGSLRVKEAVILTATCPDAQPAHT